MAGRKPPKQEAAGEGVKPSRRRAGSRAKKPRASSAVAALRTAGGRGGLSTAKPDTLTFARDCWPFLTMGVRDGDPGMAPEAVLFVDSVKKLQKAVEAAREKKVKLTPYGGGSGVCGGAVPLEGSIPVDIKGLNRILDLDRESQVVHVEAGVNGERLERWLNQQGYTLGHFPSSIYSSTVGGWIAARSAGQMSSRYGKIEDMMVGLDLVLPDGRLASTLPVPRSATGPDWNHLFAGSEGTLGFVTSARLRVHHFPEHRIFQGWRFPDLASGMGYMRALMQKGVKPAVARLYDELDSAIALRGVGRSGGGGASDDHRGRDSETLPRDSLFKSVLSLARVQYPSPLRTMVGFGLSVPSLLNRLTGFIPKQCLFINLFEGRQVRTEAEHKIAMRTAAEFGGHDLGEAPAQHWFEKRYAVSYRMSVVFDNFAWADTMEVAADWDHLFGLYLRVKEALSREAIVMAHFSHAYRTGGSIYFTFMGGGFDLEDCRSRYGQAWRLALDACHRAGGTCTHHHGVGILKADAMRTEMGPLARILDGAKAVMDPEMLMNPGKLGFGEFGGEGEVDLGTA
ncbi:MAG: FAD-binding oxidoreductase [Deltaproteobacteria bacterium]|nr:FAD-binding oxidoreductase [Deltaproteobacteria bacterium]